MYHFDGVVSNWVADNVQTFYKQYIHPLLHAGQKLVLVPASFSSNVNHNCNRFVALFHSDTRLINMKLSILTLMFTSVIVTSK